MNTLQYIIFPCLSLLVVAVLVLIVVCVGRSRRRRADGKLRGASLSVNGSAAVTAATVSEFPVSSVRLVRDVGDDHRFPGSRVYLGQLAVQQQVQRPCRPVVVRTLAVDADERVRTEFWSDVDALHALRHPHVAAVVGVTGRSVVGAVACVLLECGPDLVNLHQYLVYANNDPISLDHAARLHLAVQIAAGMDYLASRGIVHGDLASRNVMMISSPGSTGLLPAVAKLSVGLSLGPLLFPDDYQTVQPNCPLPVRWMAPEAIASGGRSLSTACDVWSYGVTLWEIYSAGCRPYEGFDDDELVELILSRQLLPCPPPPAQTAATTSRVYGMMVDCWASQPDQRPTFVEVLTRLEQWQTSDATRRTDSSRSNSVHSNSDHFKPRRPSPFVAKHTSQSPTMPIHDAFQRPPDLPPSEAIVAGAAAQSSNHARRPVNDSNPSVSPHRRHGDRHLPQNQTDISALPTVDVL